MVVDTCNPSDWEAKAGEPGVQGQLQLHRIWSQLGLSLKKKKKRTGQESEKEEERTFEASLGYIASPRLPLVSNQNYFDFLYSLTLTILPSSPRLPQFTSLCIHT